MRAVESANVVSSVVDTSTRTDSPRVKRLYSGDEQMLETHRAYCVGTRQRIVADPFWLTGPPSPPTCEARRPSAGPRPAAPVRGHARRLPPRRAQRQALARGADARAGAPRGARHPGGIEVRERLGVAAQHEPCERPLPVQIIAA